MTAHNPEEGHEEDVQKKVLQAVHDALNDETHRSVNPQHQNAPSLQARQDESPRDKAELDRLETYLRGPTVFTA